MYDSGRFWKVIPNTEMKSMCELVYKQQPDNCIIYVASYINPNPVELSKIKLWRYMNQAEVW